MTILLDAPAVLTAEAAEGTPGATPVMWWRR